VQSPVLVGRDEYLALADRRLAEVAAGNGQLLLVAGEAGIGKTRLLGAIIRRAERLGFTVARGAAYPGDAEVSGSLLLDLTSDLGPAGPVMAERLRDPGTQGDPHRQRRLLVQDLADQLLGLTIGFPLLLVLEDLHWADALSLEVIGRLAPRLATRPVLIAGAYRSDELHPRRPVRQWRGRLMTQRLAEEIRLPRLDRGQTATMTSALLGQPASGDVVAGIFDRSDGVPLHVEELLAARDVPVPQTLADAVLSRAHALAAEMPEVSEVLAAAAVIGRSFDFDLLAAVADMEPSIVDSCLRQLRESFLILPGKDAADFDFRHALIREALYLDISLPLRRKLHERAGRIAAERGYPDAFVSVHFELAQLAEPAFQYAMRAAAEATAHSAHREALQLFRRALRNIAAGLSAQEKADLLSATGDAAAAADDNTAAMEAYQQAYDLWRQAGEPVAAAGVVPRLTAVAHLLGEDLPARLRRLESALDSVQGDDGTPQAQAQLLSAMAAAYMLDRRLDEAIDFSHRGRLLSEASGELRSGLNTEATLGSVLVFAGRQDEGWALLEHEIAQAEGAHQEAEAARGYRMLGSCASVLVEYERAEHWLRRGIAYAERTELWNDRHYMAAHLAHVHWARGEWQAAQQHAEQALADGEGGITTRITALYVLGYLAMGRADGVPGEKFLTEAHDLGRGMSELQRMSPPLWGLAECALARGDYGKAMSLAENGYQYSREVADAAYVFPFLLTGLRAQLKTGDTAGAQDWLERNETLLTLRAIPGTLAVLDHGRGLMCLARGEYVAAQGLLAKAAQGWQQRTRFWEGTWALLDAAECALRSRRRPQAIALVQQAREAADSAGATTILTAAEALFAGSGQSWHPLTAREFQVAQLVAAGLTNRQIAAQLVLSPKTIAAHIEHILAKLGAARRTEIASWAAAR
jgi:predicted ATPase/DNA-binding CsgD family transcriptional regulator